MLTTALKTKTMKVMKLKLLNPMLPTPPLGQDPFWILWSPLSLCPKSRRSLWNSMHLQYSCNLVSEQQRLCDYKAWFLIQLLFEQVPCTAVSDVTCLFENSEMCFIYKVVIFLALLLFQEAKSKLVKYMPLGFDQEEEECATTKVRVISSKQFDKLQCLVGIKLKLCAQGPIFWWVQRVGLLVSLCGGSHHCSQPCSHH